MRVLWEGKTTTLVCILRAIGVRISCRRTFFDPSAAYHEDVAVETVTDLSACLVRAHVPSQGGLCEQQERERQNGSE